MAVDTSFQDFTVQSRVEDGPPRLAALREQLQAQGYDAFIIPRTDAHQGEYVTRQDARLRWLTGFSGSAGFAIATQDRAGVFIDGRYRVQVKNEVDLDHFTPVNWPEISLAVWLREALPRGGKVAYDPWLMTRRDIRQMEQALTGSQIALIPSDNLVDAIWTDRPLPAPGQVWLHPDEVAGRTSSEKLSDLAATLRTDGQAATVLTLADSIAWLLNIRGADLPRNPVVQGFAIVDDQARTRLYTIADKIGTKVRDHLGPDVSIHPEDELAHALKNLQGPVRLDPATAPDQIFRLIESSGTAILEAADPVIMPKAVKNAAEITGMRQAHLRDGAAMAEMLAWLDAQPTDGTLDEISIVRKLEGFRKDHGIFDVSFDTISSTAGNAAMNHYKVNEASNLAVRDGDLVLLDSGGQYADGTTDITRTIPMGDVPQTRKLPYTLVLKGMIDLSRLRFPRGLAGRDIDPVARAPLWTHGLDFDHGTGHGVGAALCVHEGPARISRMSETPLQPGMILSNEPGYYREGEFGIRIENLLVVTPVDSPDGRNMLGFETLTLAPIDTRLIDTALLGQQAVEWLNNYHARVWKEVSPLVTPVTKEWLRRATAPLA